MGRRKIIQDEQLLKHAHDVFMEFGTFGSTKEIARRAGISEATLFQRYPTKAALFLAAMVPPRVDVEAIIHAATSQDDPQAALVEIGHRILAYFRTLIPTVMHLMSHPSISMADVTGHFKDMPAQTLVDALAAHLRDAHSRGELRADNPMASAGLFVSAIHSLAAFELMEMHGGQNLDHAVELFAAALWNGLAPERGAGHVR